MTAGQARLFEMLVVAVLLLEWVQGTIQYSASKAAHGPLNATIDAFIAPVVSLALALAISRFDSRVAAVLYLILVSLAVISAIGDALNGWALDPGFLVGSVAILIDLVASALVIRMLMAGARP